MFQMSNHPLVPFNIRDLSPYVAGKTIEEVQAEYDPPEISKLASNENRLGCSPKVEPAVINAMQEIQEKIELVQKCRSLSIWSKDLYAKTLSNAFEMSKTTSGYLPILSKC